MVSGFEPFSMTEPYGFLAGTVRYVPNQVVQDNTENLVSYNIFGNQVHDFLRSIGPFFLMN